MSDSSPRGRRWMLTLNNPSFKESEDIDALLRSDHIKYAVWCAENDDEENHTPHYHIYISFTGPWRFNRLKNLFPRADIELAKKPELACIRYVTKGNREHSVEPFYMEFGHRNGEGGERRAADMAREQIVLDFQAKKLRYEDLTAEQLLDSKLCNAVERVMRTALGPLRPDLHVCVFISPTGWGKSFSVWNAFQEVTTVEFSSSQEWFIAPEKQVCLFDEFCGQIRCQKMLKYLDIYPIALPIKGGHRPCYWKAIFICSNTSPDQWYTKEDERTGERLSTIPRDVRQALYRRIGYGPDAGPYSHGETHYYIDGLTRMEDARNEMNEIVLRIKTDLNL